MKIKVEVKWTENDLNALLNRELAMCGLQPSDKEKFKWSMVDNTETGEIEVEVEIQAEHREQYSNIVPDTAKVGVAPAANYDPPVDMSTLYKYVPKEAIEPLTKAFEEAEKKTTTRNRLPGETSKRP